MTRSLYKITLRAITEEDSFTEIDYSRIYRTVYRSKEQVIPEASWRGIDSALEFKTHTDKILMVQPL